MTILTLSSGYFFFATPINELEKFQSNYTIKVQLLNSEVTINPGIGKKWSFHSNIDDNEVMKGETYTISLNGKTQVEISSKAIEDDKYDDLQSY